MYHGQNKIRSQEGLEGLEYGPFARDGRNLTLRPETVTNVPLYVGFKLRNRNQHAKMLVFNTEI